MFRFSQRSLRRLSGVHPDLVAICHKALEYTPVDFGITCGMRTLKEQRWLVSIGKSQTMRSRHLTGHAIDFVAYRNGKVSWDKDLYWTVSQAFKKAARELGVQIEWGGDWKSFFDGPHIQLSRRMYPDA